jgi:hypothetical protein
MPSKPTNVLVRQHERRAERDLLVDEQYGGRREPAEENATREAERAGSADGARAGEHGHRGDDGNRASGGAKYRSASMPEWTSCSSCW